MPEGVVPHFDRPALAELVTLLDLRRPAPFVDRMHTLLDLGDDPVRIEREFCPC